MSSGNRSSRPDHDHDNEYAGRLRVRVNGLLVQDESMLMVQLHSPVIDKLVWMPPGGGLSYGETMKECLVREIREETGVIVEAGRLRYLNEFLNPPYHAIEWYYEVAQTGGNLRLGTDPELSRDKQRIFDARFVPFREFSNYRIAPDFLQLLPDKVNDDRKEIVFYSA